MARIISQETFNEAVKENIEEFSMTVEEAVEDAIKQFKSQGVNLQNIITDTLLTSEVDILTEKVDSLIKILKDDPASPNVLEMLNDLKSECETGGIAKKVLAAKCGLYPALINSLSSPQELQDVLNRGVFELLVTLMTGYPDLLDTSGIEVVEKYLFSSIDEELLNVLLRWISACCIKHENNRQKFLANEKIMSGLRNAMDVNTSPKTLRQLCKLFQTFVLSDDIRADCPSSHKHACQLCNEFLESLVLCLRKYFEDQKVMISVLQALSSIIVRNEYCQQFYDYGGLYVVHDIFLENLEDESLCRACFCLVKVVSGNDNVKAKVMEIIDPSIFISVINKFLKSEKTCSQGLAALNMLTLRNPNNCNLLCEGNVAELLIQSMKVHSKSKKLQKSVCWLIKNLANGNEKVSANFLALGVEECLRDILSEHNDCKFEANVALRLLGCNVECVEQWTGEGKGITN